MWLPSAGLLWINILWVNVFVGKCVLILLCSTFRLPPSAAWQTPQCPWTSLPSLSTWVCTLLMCSCLWTSLLSGMFKKILNTLLCQILLINKYLQVGSVSYTCKSSLVKCWTVFVFWLIFVITPQCREVQLPGHQHCGPEQRKGGWRHLHRLHHEGRSCGCRRTHRTWWHAAAGEEDNGLILNQRECFLFLSNDFRWMFCYRYCIPV